MNHRPLFNTCPDAEFFGRSAEIDYLYRRATEVRRPAPNILLTAKQRLGKTEILRRVHRRLFWEQAACTPVYYQFKGQSSVNAFTEDFLKEIIKQYIAFRKRDAALLNAEISFDRLAGLLLDEDRFGLREFILRHWDARKTGDRLSALRNAINLPGHLTVGMGIPAFLMLDDFDLANTIFTAGEDRGLMKEFMNTLESPVFSFLAASSGNGPVEGGLLCGSFEIVELKGLDEEVAVTMMMDLCRQYGIEFDTEVLSFAAKKLDGNPVYIKNLIWAAYRLKVNRLVSLKGLADVYASEVFDGNISAMLRSGLKLRGARDVRMLNSCAFSTRPFAEEELAERFGYDKDELNGALALLGSAGLVNVSMGSVRWIGDGVVKDFINYLYETSVKGRSADEVRPSVMREFLKEGYAQSGVRIKSRFKEEVRDVLKAFDGQTVLKALLRNHAFAARFKNGAYIMKGGEQDQDDMALPQIIGAFDSSAWELSETGVSIIIAEGFQSGRYDEANEVAWIVGIKEASSQVTLADVDDFGRRSLILRENLRGVKVVRWMVASEGFSADAQKKADRDGIYSTDSVQFSILKDCILSASGEAAGRDGALSPVKEFEIVLPMSAKSELVGVKAAEEIGTEMGFDEDSISEIKAALVEAVINAFEHSRSKSSRVFLRFTAASGKLTVCVQNGGVDFDAPTIEDGSEPLGDGALPHKRGWGIKLMRGLMDEVRFEKIAGGTRIVMIKYLVKKGDDSVDGRPQDL